MRPQTRRKVPDAKPAKHKHESPHQGPVIFQRPEPTKAEIAEINQRLKAAQAAVDATHLGRFASPQNWQLWQNAVRDKYALYKEHVTLFAQHFSREVVPPEVARYDWDFWHDIELLKGGDQAHLGQAIAFLEADPWYHGSGYDKVRLVRYIKPPMLTPNYAGRLQDVVLRMVERRNGQEFRAYCRLARKVDEPELREQLTQRLDSGDADVRRRAQWVLDALAQWVLDALAQKDRMEQGQKDAARKQRRTATEQDATE